MMVNKVYVSDSIYIRLFRQQRIGDLSISASCATYEFGRSGNGNSDQDHCQRHNVRKTTILLVILAQKRTNQLRNSVI